MSTATDAGAKKRLRVPRRSSRLPTRTRTGRRTSQPSDAHWSPAGRGPAESPRRRSPRRSPFLAREHPPPWREVRRRSARRNRRARESQPHPRASISPPRLAEPHQGSPPTRAGEVRVARSGVVILRGGGRGSQRLRGTVSVEHHGGGVRDSARVVRDPARVDVSLRRHGVRHGRGDGLPGREPRRRRGWRRRRPGSASGDAPRSVHAPMSARPARSSPTALINSGPRHRAGRRGVFPQRCCGSRRRGLDDPTGGG